MGKAFLYNGERRRAWLGRKELFGRWVPLINNNNFNGIITRNGPPLMGNGGLNAPPKGRYSIWEVIEEKEEIRAFPPTTTPNSGLAR